MNDDEVTEEYDDVNDDWDMPDPELELEDWAETWLDDIDLDDVDGYTPDVWS